MKSITMIASLAATLLTSSAAFAVVLDSSGTGGPPDYYTCTQVKLAPTGAQGAASGGNFRINLTGYCGAHPGGGLSGWTPVAWQEIYVTGDYNYQTKKGSEMVRFQGQPVFSVAFSCEKNPWAYAPGSGNGQSCVVTGGPTNNTGVVVGEPYPISPKYLDGSTVLALREAEHWQSPEDILGDWNPYEQTGGSPILDIIKPTNYEMINQNSAYYEFVVEPKQETPNLSWVNFQIEQLEEVPELVGDIAMPQTYSHWWQPFWNGYMPASLPVTPIGISQGLFSGSTGKFRMRVVGTTPGNPTRTNIGGWTGWRYFCIGEATDQCSLSEFNSLEQATSALKAMQKATFYNFEGAGEGAALQQKVQKLANQMHDKAVRQMKTTTPQATPAQNLKPAALTKRPAGAASLSQNPQPLKHQSVPLSLLSTMESAGTVMLRLKNASPVTLENIELSIMQPGSKQKLWSTVASFPPGVKIVKIRQNELQRGALLKGQKEYQLFAGKTAIGEVALSGNKPMSLSKPAGIQVQPQGRKLEPAGKPGTRPALQSSAAKTTLKMLPPKLKIKLTLVSQNLKVDDQAIITVSVDNEGGSALGLAETYTLQCSSACPFRSQSGRLKSSLKPGVQDTFRLTSNKLAAGDYGLKVKTRYGDSDWLRFSVNARPTLQRAPSQALPRVRVVPSQ